VFEGCLKDLFYRIPRGGPYRILVSAKEGFKGNLGFLYSAKEGFKGNLGFLYSAKEGFKGNLGFLYLENWFE